MPLSASKEAEPACVRTQEYTSEVKQHSTLAAYAAGTGHAVSNHIDGSPQVGR